MESNETIWYKIELYKIASNIQTKWCNTVLYGIAQNNLVSNRAI